MLEKLQPGALAMRSSNTGCGTSPRMIRVFSVSKAGRCGRYEELPIQRFDIGQRDTEFGVCPLGFRPSLVQLFINIFLFLPCALVTYILCHCVLEACDQYFDFRIYRVLQ